jgi:predicted Zn-dependent protease
LFKEIMKKIILHRPFAKPFSLIMPAVMLTALTMLAGGCHTAPVTGRSQFMLTTESMENDMGSEAWQELLKKEKESKDVKYTAPLRRIAAPLVAAANKPNYQWEFKVISSPVANAFCLPGGKVAVYSGLYAYTANDAELACVVAHEVAHAIARHGGEQISRDLMLNVGAIAVSASTDNNTIAQLYGIAGEAGVRLPFSRTNEYEADHIGLILMARAGFDPAAAITFWQKFGKTGSTGTIAEWLSTHPNSGNRIEELRKMLPEARREYDKAAKKFGLGQKITP